MRFLLCLLTAGCTWSQAVHIEAKRLSTAPLLSPRPGWMSLGVFNPTAILLKNRTVLLFRAQDANHTSRIGYAEAADGLHFTVRPQPVLSPEAAYEQGGGVEDPRVVEI